MRTSPVMRVRPVLWSVAALLAGLAAPVRADEPKKYEVQTVRDLAYYEGKDADPIKHKLDLYLPKDHKDFPVLFFVHGGAWRSGDKNFFGLYAAVGRAFARHGIGTVVTNYRLSPGVQHPAHVEDVARAFAWTQRNVGQYGGRADQLFLCGHSAGGHLVALLASDDRYLKAVGLDRRAIRGVVPISGVYRVPERLFTTVFGSDADAARNASPLTYVRPELPPFLIVYAESDFPTCDTGSEEFCQALRERQCAARSLVIKDRNHASIILRCSADDDPTARAVRDFIHECCSQARDKP